LLFVPAACTDPSSPQDVNPIDEAETETDGLSTASETVGVTVGDTDGGGGGDSSGGSSGPSPVAGGCLFSEEDAESLNVYGYRYQCRGFFKYRLTVDADGGGDIEDVQINFGNLHEGESYEEPRVMACCPAYDAASPPCSQPHTQACAVDLAEQGCKSIVYELNAAANAESSAVREEAIRKAAEYVAEHQGDCFAAFAIDNGIAITDPACDANSSSTVDYDQMAIGSSWSFNPPGLIPQVTIEVVDTEQQGIFPWTSDPEFPGDTCVSSGDNDHVSLLELDPADPVFELKYGTAEVRGPNLIDRATLDSARTSCGDHCSGISITATPQAGTAELHWMLALGEQGQTIDGVSVDMFRAELQGPIPAVTDGRGGYEVAAGDALFALSGSAMGASSIVYASNLRPIYFRPSRTGVWDVDPIQLEYQSPSSGDVFEFFIGATTWE